MRVVEPLWFYPSVAFQMEPFTPCQTLTFQNPESICLFSDDEFIPPLKMVGFLHSHPSHLYRKRFSALAAPFLRVLLLRVLLLLDLFEKRLVLGGVALLHAEE